MDGAVRQDGAAVVAVRNVECCHSWMRTKPRPARRRKLGMHYSVRHTIYASVPLLWLILLTADIGRLVDDLQR